MFAAILLLKICAINGQSTKYEKGVCTESNSILSLYKSGYIKNPAYYPLGHKGLRKCLWRISTSKGKRIKLEFIKIVLRDTPECNGDYIQVYDGSSTGGRTLTGKLCGVRFDVEPVYSSGRHMTVIFQSKNSESFTTGTFSLKFYTVYAGIFNVGTMITIVVGVILIIINALVFRYYCRRRRNQRLRRARRIARQQAATRGTPRRTLSENESEREAEERGVVGTNLDEPPSYNAVMENSSQNSTRPRQPLHIPLQPPPLYPGTDEPETPPPPYPGVTQQPPEYPQRNNLTHD